MSNSQKKRNLSRRIKTALIGASLSLLCSNAEAYAPRILEIRSTETPYSSDGFGNTIINFHKEMQLISNTITTIDIPTGSNPGAVLTRDTFLNSDGSPKYDAVALVRVQGTLNSNDVSILQYAINNQWISSVTMVVDGFDPTSTGQTVYRNIISNVVGIPLSQNGITTTSTRRTYSITNTGNYSGIFGASGAVSFQEMEGSSWQGTATNSLNKTLDTYAVFQEVPGTYTRNTPNSYEGLFVPSSDSYGGGGSCLLALNDSTIFEYWDNGDFYNSVNDPISYDNVNLVGNAGKFAPLVKNMVNSNYCDAPKIILNKELGGSGRISNKDQFTVQIKVGDTLVNATSNTIGRFTNNSTTSGTGTVVTKTTTSQTGTTGIFTATKGTSYTLTEDMAAGSDNKLDKYTTSMKCTNARSTAEGGTDVSSITDIKAIITPKSGDIITCTITNTPKPAPTITLNKTVASRAAAVDQFTVQIKNGNAVPASATTTGTSTSATTGAYTATAGTAYTLDEVMATNSVSKLGQYKSELNCTNIQTVANGGTDVSGINSLGQTIIPKAGDVITCTITNTPKPDSITVAKTLTSVNGTAATANQTVKAGDILVYTITLTNSGGTAKTYDISSITETVPAGTTAAGGDAFNCTAGAAGGTTCTNTAAVTVAAGAFQTLNFKVKVNTPNTLSTISNTVAVPGVDCTASGQDCGETTPATPTPAPAKPNITLGKFVRNTNNTTGKFNDTTGTGYPGNVLQYCIAYKNTGGPATNFKLIDLFPDNTENQSNLIYVTPAPDFANMSTSPANQAVTNGSYGMGTYTSKDKTGPGVQLALDTVAAGTSANPTTGAICFDAQIK